MRAIAASTSSSGEASPSRTSSAWAVASRAARSVMAARYRGSCDGRESPSISTLVSAIPAPQIYRPLVDDPGVDAGTVRDVQPFVQGNRRVDVGGPYEHAVADAHCRVGREREVLVGAEPHAAVLHRRIAVVHAVGLQPAVGNGPLISGMDHRRRDD